MQTLSFAPVHLEQCVLFLYPKSDLYDFNSNSQFAVFLVLLLLIASWALRFNYSSLLFQLTIISVG